MKILFADVMDLEDPLNWSGTPFSVYSVMREKADVIRADRLDRRLKMLYTPRYLLGKWRKKQLQLDRYPLIGRSYARQIHRTFIKNNCDIVFSLSTIPVAYLPPQIPTVTWVDAIFHDMIGYYWDVEQVDYKSVELAKTLDLGSIDKNAASIFGSHWARNGATRMVGNAAKRCHVVPFGANNPRQKPGVVKTLPVSGEPLRLLFVGVDWERKGGPDLLDAVIQLKQKGMNLELSIVGADVAVSKIHTSFITAHGRLRRSVAKETALLDSLFDAAHLFVLPTHAECAGIVFAEAASYGLPVVARDTGGVSTMVTRDETGLLIEANDGAETIAKAIQNLVDNPALYMAMSAKALASFKDTYNWDTAVNRVIDICRDALPPNSISSRGR